MARPRLLILGGLLCALMSGGFSVPAWAQPTESSSSFEPRLDEEGLLSTLKSLPDKLLRREPKISRSLTIGVGFGAGSLSSGLSVKKYLDTHFAIQGVVGSYAFSGFAVGVDALREFSVPELKFAGKFEARPSVGGGTIVALFKSDVNVGITGVLGGVVHLERYPIEATLEWRPTLMLGGGRYNGFQLHGFAVAVRWYFG